MVMALQKNNKIYLILSLLKRFSFDKLFLVTRFRYFGYHHTKITVLRLQVFYLLISVDWKKFLDYLQHKTLQVTCIPRWTSTDHNLLLLYHLLGYNKNIFRFLKFAKALNHGWHFQSSLDSLNQTPFKITGTLNGLDWCY